MLDKVRGYGLIASPVSAATTTNITSAESHTQPSNWAYQAGIILVVTIVAMAEKHPRITYCLCLQPANVKSVDKLENRDASHVVGWDASSCNWTGLHCNTVRDSNALTDQ